MSSVFATSNVCMCILLGSWIYSDGGHPGFQKLTTTYSGYLSQQDKQEPTGTLEPPAAQMGIEGLGSWIALDL